MRKPKILLCNEFSALSTGYSTFGLELYKRLHKTDKYELAELAVFADPDDYQNHNLPWKVYFNQPSKKNKEEFSRFSSRQTYAFGEWGFEKTCLDFKPDIVFDIRDFWMVEFQERSPFRKNFHWIWNFVSDREPFNPQWVATLKNCDGVFTYSDWGKKELQKYSGIKFIETASPGVDLETFSPVENKNHHKKSLGLPENSFIIGTVMRNQKRKLFPELIKSFQMFLEQAPDQISNRSYLLLHTSYPDWWEIPRYLHEYGVSNRTLFTYKCRECQYLFISRFLDARTFCPRCQKPSAFIPNTHFGVSRDELNLIYNIFDVHIQYASNEGFGMPMVEAASCGIPIMAINYSAMTDVVHKLNGFPIEFESLQFEAETGGKVAIPNNQNLVDKLINFAQLPNDLQKKRGFKSRKLAEKYYNWDNLVKIWEKYFDSIPLIDISETWNRPISLLKKYEVIPDMHDIDSFVRWLFHNIIERPDLCDTYMFLRMSKDIQMGFTTPSTSDVFFNELSATGNYAPRIPFGRDEAVHQMMALAENYNQWEIERGKRIEKD